MREKVNRSIRNKLQKQTQSKINKEYLRFSAVFRPVKFVTLTKLIFLDKMSDYASIAKPSIEAQVALWNILQQSNNAG